MTAPLDERITDSFSVVGLLIAVVAGYLAAVWPVVADLLNRPRPDVGQDRNALATRCAAYSRACWALFVAAALVLVVMAPLVIEAVGTIDPGRSVDTVRSGAVLFGSFLVGGVVTAATLAVRLSRRGKDLRD